MQTKQTLSFIILCVYFLTKFFVKQYTGIMKIMTYKYFLNSRLVPFNLFKKNSAYDDTEQDKIMDLTTRNTAS